MTWVQPIESLLITFGDLAWGPWLLFLILGGGVYFVFLSRLLPFRYLGHSIALIRGKYPPEGPGELSHFRTLMNALSGTIGMGNIAGVAVAIYLGGPGAIFWMWMTALVGIMTKFFTCTLSVMYRGKDSQGNIQGGPMYVITEALGAKFRPLAIFFCIAGMIGCLPMFQINQLVQTMREVVFLREGWIDADDSLQFNIIMGVFLALLVFGVISGGLWRIAGAAAKLVPSASLLYVGTTCYLLVVNFTVIPEYLWLIVSDAFTGTSLLGGTIGAAMSNGIRRGAFSNEAGLGTESMAHGAAKTNEPVREGLVAMFGPIIDTMLICTATALVILMSGVWQSGDSNGVTMTAEAFEVLLPGIGSWLLGICIFVFSITTVFTYTYYGNKCLGFLIGAERQHYYNHIVVAMVLFASLASLDAMVGLIDGALALMAIPTMVSTIILAPKVMTAARVYFNKLK